MREVICPKCQTDAEIDTADDGNLTCLRCGHIVEETDHLRAEIDLVTSEGGTRACGSLVSETSTGTSVATSLPRSLYRSRPSSYLSHGTSKSIEKIASALRIDKNTTEQMQYMYTHVLCQQKYCRNPDLLAASIVYIVLRQNKKPYTMLDVSAALHINVFTIGRVVTRVLAANIDMIKLAGIDPSIFVDKACMEMNEWPEQKKNDIKTISAKLINALKNFWLITGRRHDGIAAAAMVIAGEALSIPVDMVKLCKALKVTETTIKTRSKEMKSALLDQSKGIIPWIKEVDVKGMHKQIPKILDTLERLSQVMHKKKDAGSPQLNADNSESSSTLQLTNDALAANPLCNSTTSIPPPSSPTPSLPAVTSTSSSTSLASLVPSLSSSSKSLSSSSKEAEKESENEPIANPLALPPSFKSNMIARERRVQKLNQAKLRLLVYYKKCPEMFSALPQLKAFLEAASSIPSLIPTTPLTPPSPLSPHSPSSSPPTTPDGFPVAPEFKPPQLNTSSSTLSPPSTPLLLLPAPSPQAPSSAKPVHPATLRRSQLKRAIKKEKEMKDTKEDILSSLAPNLDQEDLLIEKLLLNGADEHSIIDGYYETELSKANTTLHHNLESVNVGELDIPDSEMHKFIRNNTEIDVLSQLPSHQEDEVPESSNKKTSKTKRTTTKRKQRSGENGTGAKRRKASGSKKSANSEDSNSNSKSESSEASEESDEELRGLSKLPPSSFASFESF